MKGEIEKVHSCDQSIWVKGWRDGRTIFCVGPPGQKIWVEHCPKCGEKLPVLFAAQAGLFRGVTRSTRQSLPLKMANLSPQIAL